MDEKHLKRRIAVIAISVVGVFVIYVLSAPPVLWLVTYFTSRPGPDVVWPREVVTVIYTPAFGVANWTGAKDLYVWYFRLWGL